MPSSLCASVTEVSSRTDMPGAHMRRTSFFIGAGLRSKRAIRGEPTATTEDRRPRCRRDAYVCVRHVLLWTVVLVGRAAPSPLSGSVDRPRVLSAQTELLDDRPVTVDVGLGQVVQQPATLAD